MHKMFLPFLVWVGFWFANPLPDDFTLSTPTASLTGHPTEFLLAWNYSENSEGSLFVPLSLEDHHDLEQIFARGPSPAGDFRGQLIASLFRSLIKSGKL